MYRFILKNENVIRRHIDQIRAFSSMVMNKTSTRNQGEHNIHSNMHEGNEAMPSSSRIVRWYASNIGDIRKRNDDQRALEVNQDGETTSTISDHTEIIIDDELDETILGSSENDDNFESPDSSPFRGSVNYNDNSCPVEQLDQMKFQTLFMVFGTAAQ